MAQQEKKTEQNPGKSASALFMDFLRDNFKPKFGPRVSGDGPMEKKSSLYYSSTIFYYRGV